MSRSPLPCGGSSGVELTYKIAGAVCAPTANTLPVVHIVVEAHRIDFDLTLEGLMGSRDEIFDTLSPYFCLSHSHSHPSHPGI